LTLSGTGSSFGGTVVLISGGALNVSDESTNLAGAGALLMLGTTLQSTSSYSTSISVGVINPTNTFDIASGATVTRTGVHCGFPCLRRHRQGQRRHARPRRR